MWKTTILWFCMNIKRRRTGLSPFLSLPLYLFSLSVLGLVWIWTFDSGGADLVSVVLEKLT